MIHNLKKKIRKLRRKRTYCTFCMKELKIRFRGSFNLNYCNDVCKQADRVTDDLKEEISELKNRVYQLEVEG